jgi:hypothetical protein
MNKQGMQINMPTRPSTSWKSTTLVFLVSLVLLFLSMDRAMNVYDEGIVLTHAQETMHGAVVHRDFHSVYGPGSYAILAALFWLFSPSFIVARLFGITVQALIVAATFAILKVRASIWIAIGCAVVCLMWLIASVNYLYPTYPCLLLTLVGSGVLLRSSTAKRGLALFAAGCCCGLSAYFRYDAGFFAAAAQALAVMLVAVKEHGSFKFGIQRGLRSVSLLALGAFVVFLPGAIAYAMTSPLSAFRADIIDYGLNIYPEARALPFPNFSALLSDPAQFGVYLPPIIVILALPLVLHDYAVKKCENTVSFALLFSLLSLVLYYKGFVRVSITQMIFAIVPALVLFAYLIENYRSSRSWLRVTLIVTMLVIISTSTIAVVNQLAPFQYDPRRYVLGLVEQRIGLLRQVPRLSDRCIAWSGMRYALLRPSYLLVARYINRHTDQRERILVGLDRHDKIFINPMSLYYAADRLPGTRWSQYDPGIQNSREIQGEMIEDLLQNDVRYVVRDASFDNKNEPNDSAMSTGVHLLDNFIAEKYRPIAQSGSVRIWLRKDINVTAIDDVEACRLDDVSPQTLASAR